MKYINGLIKIQNYEKCIFLVSMKYILRLSQIPHQLIIQHSFLFNSKYIADFKDKPDPES